MKLDAAQKRIIQSKPFGCNVVKGGKETGKTTAAVYRALYLKNHYCLYEEDGILIVGSNRENTDCIGSLYDWAEEESRLEYITLFSGIRDKLDIRSIDDIVHRYFQEYVNSRKLQYSLAEFELKRSFTAQCMAEVREKHKNCTFFEEKYIEFLMAEISWIKATGFKSIEEYQNADRLGRRYKKGEGPQRLLKESKERKAIYELMRMYNRRMRDSGFIDEEDMVDFAWRQAKKKGTRKYAHLIIDESHKLTRSQLELIKELSNNKTYSSMMLVINTEDYQDMTTNAWFVKGRKFNTLRDGMMGKTYSLSGKYKAQVPETVQSASEEPAELALQETKVETEMNYLKIAGENVAVNGEGEKRMESNKIASSSVERFEYVDIRHYRKYDFERDPDNIAEVIVKNESGDEEYGSEYLKELPVYSDIAAGEPILMNSEQESNFYVPQYWFKGVNNCFILKVRGDSMKGANIHDGDYVVIRKQNTAQNNDIVAVDLEGSSTLKRLSLGKGGATLIPENPKYSPIPLYDREASIIGIAVGVIKNKAC